MRRPFRKRQSGAQRLVSRLGDAVKTNLPAADSLRAAGKPGLAAVGGLAGLAAASAAVSSRRRRSEGSTDAT